MLAASVPFLKPNRADSLMPFHDESETPLCGRQRQWRDAADAGLCIYSRRDDLALSVARGRPAR